MLWYINIDDREWLNIDNTLKIIQRRSLSVFFVSYTFLLHLPTLVFAFIVFNELCSLQVLC